MLRLSQREDEENQKDPVGPPHDLHGEGKTRPVLQRHGDTQQDQERDALCQTDTPQTGDGTRRRATVLREGAVHTEPPPAWPVAGSACLCSTRMCDTLTSCQANDNCPAPARRSRGGPSQD